MRSPVCFCAIACPRSFVSGAITGYIWDVPMRLFSWRYYLVVHLLWTLPPWPIPMCYRVSWVVGMRGHGVLVLL
jgi:hypothetical protein